MIVKINNDINDWIRCFLFQLAKMNNKHKLINFYFLYKKNWWSKSILWQSNFFFEQSIIASFFPNHIVLMDKIKNCHKDIFWKIWPVQICGYHWDIINLTPFFSRYFVLVVCWWWYDGFFSLNIILFQAHIKKWYY